MTRHSEADNPTALSAVPAEDGETLAAVDRAVGALLGTFVGDALGMAWEGSLPGAMPAVLEMEDERLGAGTYTDDTEMMIALAESLLRCDVVDNEDLARTFVATQDPRRGYGSGTSQVLELWREGVPTRDAAARVFDGQGSLGAMAGAIAGACFGGAAITARWVERLEDGERGRHHVEALARQLAQRARQPSTDTSTRRWL